MDMFWLASVITQTNNKTISTVKSPKMGQN